MSFLEDYANRWTPEPNTGCYLWDAGTEENPYARIAIKRKAVRVARIVCQETLGPPPTPEHQAAHATRIGCIGPACISPSHLRWATGRENYGDVPLEKQSERMRKINASYSSEKRIEIARKCVAAQTPEQHSERARKGWATRRK